MTFAQPFRDYEILERVGGGAMGTVFKARHRRLGRIVALKVLKPSLSRDDRYVERLRREARIVGSLNHPHIVSGFDMGEEAGYHFFVMEFVEGPSLRALLAEWGMFAEEHVRRVARQAALALDHAWQRGVIHRDIKPGNLLVDGNGDLKLTDLGLAKGPTDATLTRDGATIGTPYYISPEQARDPTAADVRSDLYSLGATLYHMATGVPPFQGETLAEVLTHVLDEPPVSPRAINSALSESMSLVIRKLLAKDPALRYQTPRELLDDLDRIARAEAPLADAAQLARAEGERPRPAVRGWVLAAVLLVAAGATGLALARIPPGTAADADFLAAVDREVAAQPTLAARLQSLATRQGPTTEATAGLAARRADAARALAAGIDAAADQFVAEALPALAAWIDDPAVWPPRDRVLREHLHPAVLAATGCDLSAPPPALPQTPRVAAAATAVDARLAARDAGLVAEFERFLAGPTNDAVADACARDDFRAAEAAARDALARFLDGGQRPAPGALAGPTLAGLRERALAAQQAATSALIEPAEAAVAAGLLAEAAAAAAACEELVRETRASDAALGELARTRAEMARRWPPVDRFRAGRSPWRQAEAALAAAEREASLAAALQRAARSRARWDLAWGLALAVGPAAGIVALGNEPPTEPAAALAWTAHRRVLQAAVDVEQALARHLDGRPSPALVKPIGDGPPREVLAGAVPGAESDAGRRRLLAVVVAGEPGRPLAMGDLQPAELLALLPKAKLAELMPLAATATADFAVGAAAWLLAGGDLDGFARCLPDLADAEERALVEEVAPTLARVRAARPDEAAARLAAFQALQQQFDAARATGATDGLEQAIARIGALVGEKERTDAEATLVAAARTFVQAEFRRRSSSRALAAAAPAGAGIEVQLEGGRVAAQVRLDARALQVEAPAAWRLQDGALALAAAPREAAQRTIRCSTGFDAEVGALTATVDVVFPPAAVGARAYVLALRGVAVVVCLDQDDGMHAAVVRGDPERDEDVRLAVGRALRGVFGPVAAHAVPGAAHRLTLQVTPNAARSSAVVEVRCDGVPLLAGERRSLDARRVPDFALAPLQALTVQRVAFAGDGG
jgi:tRNA A-37 threonylcarbamoyl transferase component Bud32